MSAEYTVFIDESFYKWFGLPTAESNLCYGALSLPSKALADLERFEKAIRQFAFDKLPSSVKQICSINEFKYADFRHLSCEVIDKLGDKLNRFLKKNEATIFGYFIPAEGFLNYKLRSDFIDELNGLKNLPEAEYRTQIEAIRQEMLQEWKDAEHNLGLLEECYKTFFHFIVQYQGAYLKQNYEIIYDSRHPDEDAALHKAAETFARTFERAAPGAFARYRGYKSATSVSSAGLRLVDWIVGEVRTFFYRNPEVLSSGSSFDILSPYPNREMILIGTGPYYRRELSEEAKSCFNDRGKGFMLPQIKQHFASGLLTYYAKHGEARHITIPTLTAFDMAD